MVALGPRLLLLLLLLPPHAAPQLSATVNLSHGVRTLSPLMNGFHFSPLNHQVQVLYANLLFDESFEQTPLNGCRSNQPGQPLCPCGSPGCKSPPAPTAYGNYANHSWVASSATSAAYVIEPRCSDPDGAAAPAHCAFNGNVSFRLQPATDVVNRGLYKQGFVLQVPCGCRISESHAALLRVYVEQCRPAPSCSARPRSGTTAICSSGRRPVPSRCGCR